MSYEIILFDADGTLFDYDKAEAYALKKAFKHFDLKYSEENELKAYRIINSQIWLSLEKGEIDFNSLLKERFRKLFENHEGKVDHKEFSDIYLSLLAEGIFLVDGAEEICRYISNKYKIIILTNGIRDVQLSRINNSTLNKYISGIIVSEETGYKKPDLEIFDYVFDKIGHTKKETALIIGDSLTSDIQGGINYGIDTCWYNSVGIENKTSFKPNYVIRDLRELMKLL